MTTINLPALPASWDELSPEQMEYVCQCRYEQGNSQENFLFHLFLYFAKLKIVKGKLLPDDRDKNKYKHLFQQTDGKGKAYGPMFPIEKWQIHYYITEYLQWLTKECTRLDDLYPTITLNGLTFGSPGYAMANMTYQQQKTAQQYYAIYCQIAEQLFQLIQKVQKGNAALDEQQINELVQQRQTVKCKFLATVYSPEADVTTKTVDGETIRYTQPEKKFIFHSSQTENNWKLFLRWDEYKGDAVMQLFNGVMLHYKKIFPLLFTDATDNNDSPDFIDVEQSTINALQSELQFANYQTIYDSNAPFIFGKLNELLLRAKKLKEQEIRSRTHRHK